MRAFTDFFKGIEYFFKGVSFLFGKGLWYYMLYPIILWVAMFAATVFLVGDLVDTAVKWFEAWVGDFVAGKSLFNVRLEFLVSVVSFISNLVLRLALYYVGGTVVKYITLVLMSPLLSRLSEVLESKITGKKFDITLGQFLKDVWRGVLITVRNMFFEYLFIIAGFIVVLLFPPLVLIVTPLLFFISCYYYGFTMMDYSCERHKLSVRESTAFIHSNKALVCGIGCCLLLMFKIPTLYGDLIAITIGPAAACIGATLAFHEARKHPIEAA